MRPTIEDLHNPKVFKEIAAFHVDETLKFIFQETGITKKDGDESKTKKYILMFVLMLIGAAVGFAAGKIGITGNIAQIVYGFLLMFLVVLPIHEGIHGLVFKSLKAPDVGFGASLKAQ